MSRKIYSLFNLHPDSHSEYEISHILYVVSIACFEFCFFLAYGIFLFKTDVINVEDFYKVVNLIIFPIFSIIFIFRKKYFPAALITLFSAIAGVVILAMISRAGFESMMCIILLSSVLILLFQNNHRALIKSAAGITCLAAGCFSLVYFNKWLPYESFIHSKIFFLSFGSAVTLFTIFYFYFFTLRLVDISTKGENELKTLKVRIEELGTKYTDLQIMNESYETATSDLERIRKQLWEEFEKSRSAKEEAERKSFELQAANEEIEAMNESLVESRQKLEKEIEISESAKKELERKNSELEDLNENILIAKQSLELATIDLEKMRNQLWDEMEKTRNANRELEQTNEVLIETRDALWGEMELAKKIQTVLLPQNPTIVDFMISVCMIPADEVGGDYYDIINIGNMNWIVIGDVSGHGVSAGLVMMMVQTSIRTVLNQNSSLKPSKLLSLVNDVISENIKKLGETKYMTITVLANYIAGKFTFSGLHLDILLFRSKGNIVDQIETQGMWLGFGSEYDSAFEDRELSLEPGDILCLYTDGITEAMDDSDNMFTTDRLSDLLLKHGEKSPERIKSAIIDDLKNYKQKDDVSLVIIKKM